MSRAVRAICALRRVAFSCVAQALLLSHASLFNFEEGVEDTTMESRSELLKAFAVSKGVLC